MGTFYCYCCRINGVDELGGVERALSRAEIVVRCVSVSGLLKHLKLLSH